MTFFKQTIATVPLQGEVVLVRTDFNVPLRDDGSIADDFRIRSSLPTIQKLLKYGCKVVIISHLGRPDGADPAFSLEPAAQRLAGLLQMPIRFVSQTTGDRVRMAVKRAPKCSVIVLENLRYHPEEEANDPEFAKAIVRDTGARYFVQDGFGVVHRAHASTAAVTMYVPSVAGMLLEREYTTITNAMSAPKRPLVAVLGGAKVSDKIEVIQALIQVADTIVIGGAMANTFLAYKGLSMGASKCETDKNATLDDIYATAAAKVGADNVDEFIVLPTDLAVATVIDGDQSRRVIAADQMQSDDIALDIGDDSIERAVALVQGAKTVIWNGPVGYATLSEFAHGSARLALAMATHPDITSIIGGGDTADFVLDWDARDGASFTHVSTGGGASLELMAGRKLPGVESLLDA
ncbi:MAG: phosphoglycerate kinase [Candidatus Saccharimonadales bacterium]